MSADPTDHLYDDPAAWVADDLDGAERATFAEQLRRDPVAQRDVSFWQRVRPAFTKATQSSDGLGNGFALAVLARAQREQQRSPRQMVIRLPLWTATAVALAAALLMVVLLLPSAKPSGGGMWLEDGSAVTLQARGADWSDYLPRALVHQVSHRDDSKTDVEAHNRPWLGLWSRPVDIIDNGNDNGSGHLVLRVVSGSPADRIGLRPGDVITKLNDCPLFSTQCIAHQLSAAQPGDTMMVDWFRPRSGEQFHTPLTLEAVYE